jgi:cell division septal protein FtsQ
VRRLLAAFLIVVVLVTGAAAVARSQVFGLRTLSVEGPGSAFVTEQALALSARTSLLLLSPSAVAERAVTLDPWARAAEVRVTLPHDLSISLVPRVPVALVQSGGTVWAVTAGGMVLPATAAERRALPYLTGVPAPTVAMRVDTDLPLLSGAAVAAALPASVVADVSEVHAVAGAGGESFELVLMDGRPVMLGPPVELGQKLALLPVLLERYPWPEYAGTGFDLRDPMRPSLYSIGR